MASMHDSASQIEAVDRAPRGPVALTVLVALGIALVVAFVALGNWQVRRLAWKRDLIARVDARVRAPAIPAPGPADWAGITASSAEYRHVRLDGVWLRDPQTRVWTATALGSGYWILAPLRRTDGSIVLVNRGFAPDGWCDFQGRCPPPQQGRVALSGLLRMSEPPGLFRRNDPVADSWYTRDVSAIARARGLTEVAPYFVDADLPAGTGVPAWPRGGMTVIAFPNHHLSYLITWYALALMTLGAGVVVALDERALRRRWRVA